MKPAKSIRPGLLKWLALVIKLLGIDFPISWPSISTWYAIIHTYIKVESPLMPLTLSEATGEASLTSKTKSMANLFVGVILLVLVR